MDKFFFKMKKQFFLKNFFEGKLSLALSFWVFGFISLSVLGLIAVLIYPSMRFASMRFARLIVYPYLIYASIGIWRSSDNYKGKKIFAILAKIMIVLWNINHLLGLLTYLFCLVFFLALTSSKVSVFSVLIV